MSLYLSYNVNIETTEAVGTSPAAYSELANRLLIQSNSNLIENCKSVKLSYRLGAAQTATISLEDLGVKHLNLVSVKSTNIVRLNIGTDVITGSNLFIEKKVPVTIPTTVSADSFLITNINSEIVDVEVILVYLV
jgi:hypothetical protein